MKKIKIKLINELSRTKGRKVLLNCHKTITINKETSLLKIINDFNIKKKHPIIAAKINNKIKELTEKINKGTRIEFLDLGDRDAVRIYRRGLSFVLVMAARVLYPGCRVNILHSLSKGVYCEIEYKRKLQESDIKKIEAHMKKIIKADQPFVKKRFTKKEAVKIFIKDGQLDKAKLFNYRKKNDIYLYLCDGIVDYYYGYMPPGTGYLKHFELKFYPPGFILRYPERGNPETVPKFTDNKQLAKVLMESRRWAKILEVSDLASFNEAITKQGSLELIKIAEALHEKKIAYIADTIYKKRNKIKLILISGPSSSGKTTFTQRLIIQLRVNGLKPVAISTDNYFLDRISSPLGKDGQYDFESIEAIDTKLFNEHLYKLLNGQTVETPKYNFIKGKRAESGRKIKLSSGQIILVEGIHALNKKLAKNIAKSHKFKIYVSALTQLNLDSHNRIHTTDSRLIRRIIRDYHQRGHSCEETLAMWDSVRRGEEKNIFPFQEEADIMFNSALVYEMAVLKKYLVALLKEVKRSSPVYPEAVRLSSFISYFKEAPSKYVPSNSILTEFITGAALKC